jgi:glycosyltransferase involved in cell wall biosynthesis
MITNKLNIVYLYTELMPYNIVVIKELIRSGAKMYVFYYDKFRKTPYSPSEIDGCDFFSRYDFSDEELFLRIKEINPAIVYTSGWIDKGYVKVSYRIKNELDIPIVCGSDTQWRGGKQWINVITSFFRQKRWFSHIFVSGIWQYEYARKLGFHKDKILFHNLSGDIYKFCQVDIESKKTDYPKNILYAGRFSKEKGLIPLLDAWKQIPDKKGWSLTLIGAGPLESNLKEYENITVKNFMNQDELIKEAQQSGCFILSSIFEQWSLVLHEFAAAGLPILSSDRCGAVPYFVLNGYNGYLFKGGDIASIKQAIIQFIEKPTEVLIDMSYKSRELSHRITPSITAHALLSVLKADN